MKRIDVNRRDFNKLTMAAFGGLVAGTTIGCSEQDSPTPTTTTPGDGGTDDTPETDGNAKSDDTEEVSLLMQEPHVCRGLNSCKDQGASKQNDCAGQGACATVAAHACGGMNECKGQGGCGEKPGENACKAMGKCSVPLMDKAWTSARAAFETAMQAAENPVGAAPAKPES